MNLNAKILLVEDDPKDVELTLEALSEYNILNDIKVLHDGEQALDYLFLRDNYAGREPGNPALILLDLKMPKVSGHEVLKAIKNDDDLRTIPVVILTSSNMERDLVESYENGANAYVVKPVNYNDFLESVKKLGLFWVLVNEPPKDQKNS